MTYLTDAQRTEVRDAFQDACSCDEWVALAERMVGERVAYLEQDRDSVLDERADWHPPHGDDEDCGPCVADYERGVRDGGAEFVAWVASNGAFNGAGDRGQEFYDRGLNTWLSLQLVRFLQGRTDAPDGHARHSMALAWEQGYQRGVRDELSDLHRADNPYLCHCGEVTYQHADGFTRGLCQRCDAVRCDVDPAACKR